jgi:acyl-coenzyme A synthetase/AMP-(fatty) acid ligase
VIAFDDPLAGKRLHALVRRGQDAQLGSLQLRARCARGLAPAAIPAVIDITDQPLPKTITGKVDRRAVRLTLEGDTNGSRRRRHPVHR